MSQAREIAEGLDASERTRIITGNIHSKRFSPVVSRLAGKGLVTFVRNKGRVFTPLGLEVRAILQEKDHG